MILLINQNNRTKYIFFSLRKIDSRNKWKNHVIVTRDKLGIVLVLYNPYTIVLLVDVLEMVPG